MAEEEDLEDDVCPDWFLHVYLGKGQPSQEVWEDAGHCLGKDQGAHIIVVFH